MRRSLLLRISGLALVASCLAPTDGSQPIGPMSLSVVSGNNQSGLPGQELAQPLVARVEDSRGRAVRGQIVNFRVVSGGGSVFAGAAITGRDGLAQERWTLGFSGAQRVEARAVDPETGAPLTFAVFTATLIDTQPPHLVFGPENFTVEPGQPVILGAEANDTASGNSAINRIEFNVDAGAFATMPPFDGAYDSPQEFAIDSVFGLTTGTHLVCGRAFDAAGNVSITICHQVTVASNAVFVSLTGNEFNPGTQAAPVRTIETGLQRALDQGKSRVNVAAGTYNESVQLRPGVSLYGGYNPATWTRNPAVNITTIAPTGIGDTAAVAGSSVGGLTIDGFTIMGPTASPSLRSSFGIVLTLANNVAIQNNVITARPGLGGATGTSGAAGAAGGNGIAGGFGAADNADAPGLGGNGGTMICTGVGSVSAGGRGGNGGSQPSFTGQAGAFGGGFGGGPGGFGGGGGATGNDGGNGATGTSVGASGASGVGGANFGTIVFGLYLPANGSDGGNGAPGSAGGGGGGGGGQTGFAVIDGSGNGGGGGGTGGCPGLAGRGGAGGGGSFGIVLFNSGAINVDSNSITTGNGGDGGNGGTGGAGGAGGAGGLGGDRDLSEVGRGGNGGNGRTGGTGGGGGGGGGGPSIGILAVSTVWSQANNTFSIGSAGVGGLGGGTAPNGAAGLSRNIHEIF